MARLTIEDLKTDGTGDWCATTGCHWINIRETRRGEFRAVAFSVDWCDDDIGRSSMIDSEDGFDTTEEALAWGVETINSVPMRLACSALETAFAAMAEWTPLVAPFVATARAEAALAEREACARDVVDGTPSYDAGHSASTRAFVDGFVARELSRRRDRIRARTTPATLSTETLAAIAEARGLRVVEPELLAGIDATALATAERERDEARAELAKERADLAALTARVEAEIAAAAEAVRARTIAECVAKAGKIAAVRQTVASQRLSGIDARHHWDDDPELAAAAHEMADRLDALEEAERAATAEPADVDPAAGALR